MNICSSRYFIFGTPYRNTQTGQIKQKQLSKQLVADDFHPSSLPSAANPSVNHFVHASVAGFGELHLHKERYTKQLLFTRDR